jgi:gag-polyprotein putative aspartyl protease/Sel1 repeat
MRKLIGLLIVIALLSAGQLASAGPFEDGEAAYNRGDGYAALLNWRELAVRGDAKASYRLGKLFSEGRGPSVPSDQKEARRWWLRAVEQGHAQAAGELSRSYFFGIGFPPVRDVKEAVKWARVAVLRGDSDQIYLLGLIYGGPYSVDQDFVRAHMWFSLFRQLSLSDGEIRRSAAANYLVVAEAKMSATQISHARQSAAICLASGYRDCDEPDKELEYVKIANLPSKPNAEPQRIATSPPPKPQAEPAKAISPPQIDSTTTIAPTRSSATSIPMLRQGGTFVVPVLINGKIELSFVVDSGAADVSIPADVVRTMIRSGTLDEKDFGATKTYILADGSRVQSRTFRIRSLKVGDRVIENVMGSEAHIAGDLLLGQSFLGKFKSWSIDNTKHALVLE